MTKEIKSNLHRRLMANLKSRRRELNLTQRQLGDLLGMGQSAYSQIENGHFEPSMEMTERIAKTLGLDPGDLFSEVRLPAGTA